MPRSAAARALLRPAAVYREPPQDRSGVALMLPLHSVEAVHYPWRSLQVNESSTTCSGETTPELILPNHVVDHQIIGSVVTPLDARRAMALDSIQ